MEKAFEETKKYLSELSRKSFELRKEKMGFAGLDYQLTSIRDKMMLDFSQSAAIKHSGDKGTAREGLLRAFLADSGYLPERFGVSQGSSHVVSTTGDVSEQIDLLIYDRLNCPRLLTMSNIQYFPVESVYGIIQVKSGLDSEQSTLDALQNIASFKRLRKSRDLVKKVGPVTIRSGNSLGFGMLFAYDSKLKWRHLYDCIRGYQKSNSNLFWPNLVVILDQGLFIQLKNNRGVYSTEEILEIDQPKVLASPNRDSTLLQFYLILIDLLANMSLSEPPLRDYVHLRMPAGNHSYCFEFGPFSEIGVCKKHGEYLRTISSANVERVIRACKQSKPINWIKATDIALGKPGDDDEVYGKQPGDVLIYNPEKRRLSDILFINKDASKGFHFDAVLIDGVRYWIPWFYNVREKLITGCPKCK